MRTLIVALAIAVGVYAVGVVLNTREILVREYHSDQAGARVPSAILYTQPFDDDLAANLADLPLVAAAEGRSLIRTRVYPAGQTPQDLVLVAVPEFSDMQVNAITPLQGAWPPSSARGRARAAVVRVPGRGRSVARSRSSSTTAPCGR